MEGTLQKIIRDIVIAEMEESGITQAELARRLNVSRTAVQKTLFDESKWTIARMERVASALGLNLHITVKPHASRLQQLVAQPDEPKGEGER